MSHKLDKETLDKVRGIDGFPIGDDEDVNTLSIHPNYTACPNPWLEDFVKENGSSYDSNNDDYQKRPFAHQLQLKYVERTSRWSQISQMLQRGNVKVIEVSSENIIDNVFDSVWKIIKHISLLQTSKKATPIAKKNKPLVMSW